MRHIHFKQYISSFHYILVAIPYIKISPIIMTHIWPKITQFDTFISSFSPLSTRLFSLTHNSLSQSEQVYTGFIASLASQNTELLFIRSDLHACLHVFYGLGEGIWPVLSAVFHSSPFLNKVISITTLIWWLHRVVDSTSLAPFFPSTTLLPPPPIRS